MFRAAVEIARGRPSVTRANLSGGMF